MNRPCATVIICPCTDNPLGNFSVEAPDPISFRRLAYPLVNPNNPIGPGGPGDPPVWYAMGCESLCVSTISQDDADLCAARQAFICDHTPPGGTPPQMFFNTPQVCGLACDGNSQFVWFVPGGSFVGLTQEAANEQALAFACQQAARNVFCLNPIPNTGQVGIAYGATLFTSGDGSSPFTFTVTAGALPPGLTLTGEGPLSALLAGTPTASGTYNFSISATDSRGVFVTKPYTIQVLQITPATLPNGTVGTAYSQQLTLNGGTGAVTFANTNGTLPAGLTLSSAGLISGTPTAAATSNFEVTAVDSLSNTCIQEFSLQVIGCGATTDWINNPGTCRLRIHNYVDGLFANNQGCAAFDAGAGVVWDGTFKDFVQLVPNTACRYDIVGQGFGQISGFAIAAGSGQFFLTFTAGHWTLNISALKGGLQQTLWTSNPVNSTNPIGTYTFFNGCSNPPASLTIEGFSP